MVDENVAKESTEISQRSAEAVAKRFGFAAKSEDEQLRTQQANLDDFSTGSDFCAWLATPAEWKEAEILGEGRCSGNGDGGGMT